MFAQGEGTQKLRVRFVIKNISHLVTAKLFIIGPVGQHVRY